MNHTSHTICRVFAILLCGIAASLPAAAPADPWVDSRVFGPFVCRADFVLAPYESVFTDLAEIQHDLARRLGLPPAQERIELYLFRDQAAYQAYLQQWFPKMPYRRALYVKNRGPGMVLAYRSEELAVDVRHECTHALLHAVLPMVPLWLDEGLAEYFEIPASRRLLDNPHHSTLVWHFRLGQVPRLDRLEAIHELDQMGRSEYRHAWAWAHFLLHGPDPARQVLIDYLADIRAAAPPGQISQRLKLTYPDPEAAMVRHFKSLK